MTKLENLLTTYPTLSLKKVSDTFGACYQYVLKMSKKPITGQIYDEKAVNYEEVEKVLLRKGSFEDFDWNDIVNSVKVYQPLNQLDEFEVGTSFRFRYDDEEIVRTIVYKNDSYVVHCNNNDDKPSVMNNDTFLHQSPRIVK